MCLGRYAAAGVPAVVITSRTAAQAQQPFTPLLSNTGDAPLTTTVARIRKAIAMQALNIYGVCAPWPCCELRWLLTQDLILQRATYQRAYSLLMTSAQMKLMDGMTC